MHDRHGEIPGFEFPGFPFTVRSNHVPIRMGWIAVGTCLDRYCTGTYLVPLLGDIVCVLHFLEAVRRKVSKSMLWSED